MTLEKLTAIVKTMAEEFNKLEQRVELLEANITGQKPSVLLNHITVLEARVAELEACDCVVDFEDGSTIQPCAKHPQGGSPKGKAIHAEMKGRS